MLILSKIVLLIGTNNVGYFRGVEILQDFSKTAVW